jgi:hypothetical protein
VNMRYRDPGFDLVGFVLLFALLSLSLTILALFGRCATR